MGDLVMKMFTVVSWGISRLDVFQIGNDNIMWHTSGDGNASNWQHSWDSLEGSWTRPATARLPVAVSRASNRLDVFAIGLGDNVYRKTWDGDFWMDGWASLGNTTFSSSPAAVAQNEHRLDLFGLGDDSSVNHYASNDGDNWILDDLGGSFNDAPVVTSWANDRMDVFVRGRGNILHHKAYDGGHNGWQAEWDRIGNQSLTSQPAVVSWGRNRLDIFALDQSHSVIHQSWDGNQWQSGWDSLGGNFTGEPAAVARSSGRLDIFAVGQDGQMYHQAWDGNRWQSDWDILPGIPTSSPVAISRDPDSMDIFQQGFDEEIWHQSWSGSEWNANWTSLGTSYDSPIRQQSESGSGSFNSSAAPESSGSTDSSASSDSTSSDGSTTVTIRGGPQRTGASQSRGSRGIDYCQSVGLGIISVCLAHALLL
ncbi:MAG: hypothetical protein Q9226_002679 [Calogaya cf. arnoldii]